MRIYIYSCYVCSKAVLVRGRLLRTIMPLQGRGDTVKYLPPGKMSLPGISSDTNEECICALDPRGVECLQTGAVDGLTRVIASWLLLLLLCVHLGGFVLIQQYVLFVLELVRFFPLNVFGGEDS